MSNRKRILLGLLLSGAGSSLLATSGCETTGEMAILDVMPRVGSASGEQSVRIVGQHFRQDIGYTIYFGTKKTMSVTIRDPETMEVVTPQGNDVGKVDIMIRTDDGNAYRITDAFAFQAAASGTTASDAAKAQKGNLAY
jgi:hypothetical protein